ncbi:MAG TPA: hypothetical protein VIC05_01795 [Solirubrobacteraceae bacterium]
MPAHVVGAVAAAGADPSRYRGLRVSSRCGWRARACLEPHLGASRNGFQQRIREPREAIGKLRAERRELTFRRCSVTPGWVGAEMAEEFDEPIGHIDDHLAEPERFAGSLEKPSRRRGAISA